MEKQYTVTDFSLDEKTLMLHETLFHNANGYLGVRGCLEEGVPQSFNTMRGTYVNGFYDVIPMKQSESLCNLMEEKDTMLNVADMQSIRLRFEGEEFSLFSGTVLSASRTLNMDAGTTERLVRWRSPAGREVTVRFIRMASFTCKNVFTITCEVCPENFSGTLEVISYHKGRVKNYANPKDPRLAASGGIHLQSAGEKRWEDATYLLSRTVKSGLTVCTGVRHDFPEEGRLTIDFDAECHSYTTRYEKAVQEGKTLRFTKYTVTVDSLRSDDCLKTAEELMEANFGRLHKLCADQRQYLRDFWRSAEMEIDSGDDSSIAMAFNQYQLLQSCGSDGLCAAASKGLSGEGYEGHYFWDTEIYVLPFLTYTAPQLARSLLRYRYMTLPLAKENARLLGHRRGALYPWRTISGRECSGFFPAGSAQYHIDGDIACAVVRYYLATGDKEYLAQEGAEILIETARLWMDVGNWHEGRFVINDVTGPDEYTCIVNNNYYTNACARYNLRWASRLKELMKGGDWETVVKRTGIIAEEMDSFSKAAENMYLPFDETLGINPQDDSFLQKPLWDFAGTPKENYPLLLHYHPLCLYRHQVCKQADTILAYLLYDTAESRETMLRSFEYYEKITTHDSSLSHCVFSIVAARLGLYDKAWEYFGESIKSDLVNSHGNTGDGIHTANMGGSYMMIVNGFAGVNVNEAGLSIAPFLPRKWNGYRFRLWYRGSFLEVDVRKEHCTVRLLEGPSVALKLYGQEISLSAERAEYVAEQKEVAQ